MAAATGEDLSADQSRPMLIVIWVFFTLTTIVLILRAYVKFFITRLVKIDDWLMFIGWPLALCWSILLTLSAHYGLGRHITALTDEDRRKALHYDFSAQAFGVMTPMFGRISWAFFMLNFAGTSKSGRWALYILIILQILVGVATVVQIYTQCGKDIAALWDDRVLAHATCESPSVQTDVGFFQSALNSFTDLYLTIMPAYILMGLQMKLRLKLAAGFFLGLSIFALIASVVKTYEIKHLGDRGDFTFNTPIFFLWTVIEIHLVYICGSVPMLRPLFGGKNRSTGYESHEMYTATSTRRRVEHSNHIWANPRDRKVGQSTQANSSEEDILGKNHAITKTTDVYITESDYPPEAMAQDKRSF